ncbi:oligosaccharide flippase family protein [Thiospirillum jenense]|uniref:Oligosaccharide flippase family protein n=1 Tax=Thiospirillum jenense TaxID=1653858 RepID=A0A839HCN1_9GAMM|nr:oligosaccharide flippase family protein [Thiospirillum jenense]MBB1125900.1 oligosaccharide flippase family protein [Thiospirillum jenense]
MNIRRSLLVTFFANYFQIVLQFIATLIIARLLTPSEFGIFSLSMILINLADLLRNFGVNSYIVQEKDLTWGRLRAARLVNFMFSWGLAVVVWLLADWTAQFFDEPAVAAVLHVLVVNFILIPFGTTTAGLLRRELQFQTLAVVQIITATASTLTSIILALLGFSYFSLAWGNIANVVVGTFLIWYFRPRHLKLPPGRFEIWPVLRFGGLSVITAIAHETGKRLPDLFFGKLLSVQAVGYFSRATGLLELINQFLMRSIFSITMPHFAAQVRQQTALLPHYLLAISHITVLGWPFLLLLVFTAPQLIPLLYGEQWYESIILVQILCLGEMLLVPFYLRAQILIAIGRIAIDTRFALIMLVVKTVFLLFLTQFGLIIVTFGLAVSNIVAMLLSYHIMRDNLNCSLQELWMALRKSLLVSGTIACSLLLITRYIPTGILSLVACVGIAALAWITAIFILQHPIKNEILWLVSKIKSRLAI